MRHVLFLLVALVAQCSALVVGQVPSAVSARSSSPVMKAYITRVEVEVEQGEPLEKALRRFRTATNMSGHLRILRNRKMFESTHDKQIRKEKESLMRRARARRSARNRM